MIRLWGGVLCLGLLSMAPGYAEVYRWTDSAGKAHYTDQADVIPPERRHTMRSLPAGETGSTVGRPQPPPVSRPPSAESPSLPGVAGQNPGRPGQTVQELESQIGALLQDRRQLLDQLKAVRDIRMNPAFGRERRRVAAAGQALAEVEMRLDTLYAALQEKQTASSGHAAETARVPSSGQVLEAQGHDQAYWRQRAAALRTEWQQARERRQTILSELAKPLPEEQGAFGRRGREVLQLVETLEHATQTMRQAEEALQALQQEAHRAGVPAAWLQ